MSDFDNETMDYTNDYDLRYKKLTTAKKTVGEVQVRDTFETPNYATDLIIPFIPKYIGIIWECAAGNLKIAKRLESRGYGVIMSDIRLADKMDFEHNFINDKYNVSELQKVKLAIITNPPYSIKKEFVEKAFEYNLPFAFLISGEYSGTMIKWIQRGCEKVIPTRRINYITPSGREGSSSSSQFHTLWLTYKFGIGRTETFVDLPLKEIKENI